MLWSSRYPNLCGIYILVEEKDGLSAMNPAVGPRASRPRSSPGLLLLGLLLLPAIALAQGER